MITTWQTFNMALDYTLYFKKFAKKKTFRGTLVMAVINYFYSDPKKLKNADEHDKSSVFHSLFVIFLN